jgi:hypothetical protein
MSTVDFESMEQAVQNSLDETLFNPKLTKHIEEFNDTEFCKLVKQERCKRRKAILIKILFNN